MSIDVAKKVAVANDRHPYWSFGACLVRGGSIQAVGWNRQKRFSEYDIETRTCVGHAEIHTLRQVGFRARRSVLYIARWKRHGGFGIAKPCDICQPIVAKAGVKRVIYTIDNEFNGVWTPH